MTFLLLPLTGLYCLLSAARRLAYRLGVLQTVRLPVPVIVVGNITVGGTGKTPLVIWLARYLTGVGYRPGIISRGYGGRSRIWPRAVEADSDPDAVGDEPVLLARHSGCPVWVGPDRVQAGRSLLDQHACDILLSDDGLQHLRMARDIEIAVLDGERRLGNGLCLPAGPLREPSAHLGRVDLVVVNGGRAREGELSMTISGQTLIRLQDRREQHADTFAGKPAHAVAGIGNPDRFFRQLEHLGVYPIRHGFPDHYRFLPGDLDFGSDDTPVIMTEKDAVKCRGFAGENCWYLAVTAEPDPEFARRLRRLLQEKVGGPKTA